MSPSLPLSKNSFDTFLSLRKLLKFGQVWLKFGVVSEIRATHVEHPRSDKRDGYWEDMSSCIGQSPRYSPGKRILEEWYDCIYIFVDCGWQKMKKSKSCVIGGRFHRGRGRVSRFENEPVKNSITRVEGTRRVQRRKWGRVFWLIGPRGNRLEIGYYYPVNAVTVATNRTFNHLRYRTPRDEIASSLSFDVARIYLVQSRPTTTVSLSSTSISSRVQHSIFDTSCERERNERWLSICLQHPLRFDDASLSSISGEQRRTVHFFRSKKNCGIMKRTGRYFQEFIEDNYIQILLIPLHNSNRELDVIIPTRDSSSSSNFRFEIQRDRNIRIKLKPSTLTSIFTPREFFPSVLWKSTSLRHLVDDLKFAT